MRGSQRAGFPYYKVIIILAALALVLYFSIKEPEKAPSFEPPPSMSTLPAITSSTTSVVTTTVPRPVRETQECVDLPRITDKNNCYKMTATRFRDPEWCRRVKDISIDNCMYDVGVHTLDANFCNEIRDSEKKQQCLSEIEKQETEASIRSLNVWSKVKTGEIWTSRFQTSEGGKSDLELMPERGSTFTEYPVDDEATVDDLEFISLSCEGDVVKDFIRKDRYRGFVFNDYSCNGETVVSVRVLTGGVRHRMKVNYGLSQGFGVGAEEP